MHVFGEGFIALAGERKRWGYWE